jgi:ABC-type transport system involved in cytochrome bd biosynthesis fused ATPase/permease subunit
MYAFSFMFNNPISGYSTLLVGDIVVSYILLAFFHLLHHESALYLFSVFPPFSFLMVLQDLLNPSQKADFALRYAILLVVMFLNVCLLFFGEYYNSIMAWLQTRFATPIRTFVSNDEDLLNEYQKLSKITEKNNDSAIVLNLRKEFNSHTLLRCFNRVFLAVKQLSFGVSPGQLFGILGSNGAGKTTTFRMLIGELLPTAGSITINGFDIAKNYGSLGRLKIGYCPQVLTKFKVVGQTFKAS